MLDAVQQLISCHYDLYPDQSQASACLPLLTALLASLLGCQVQHQLAEAVGPLLASAAKQKFMQAIEPDMAALAAAAVNDLLAKLLGDADNGSGNRQPAASQGADNAASMIVTAADEPWSAHAASKQHSEQVQQDTALSDMFKFRPTSIGEIAGRPLPGSDSSSADSKKNSLLSTPGLFGNLLEFLQHRHFTGHAESAAESKPVAAGVQQLPEKRILAGPVAEGLLRIDSDEALEAVVKALESAGQAGMVAGTAHSGSTTAASSGAVSWGKKAGEVGFVQLGRRATELDVPATTSNLVIADGMEAQQQGPPAVESLTNTLPANQIKRPYVAGNGHVLAAEAPVSTDIVLHTKLEYDSGSSGGGNPLTAALLKRRTTASAVLSDSGLPALAQESSSSTLDSLGSAPVLGGSKGRHTRIRSLGAMDGLFSRLGRAREEPAQATSTTSDTLLAEHHSVPTTATVLPHATSAGREGDAGILAGGAGLGSKVLDRIIRHGRSGSAGSLDLWKSHKACQNEQQLAVESSSASDKVTHADLPTGKGTGSAAVAVVTVDAGAVSVMVTQGAARDEDVINLTVAVGMVKDELQRDIRLQVSESTALVGWPWLPQAQLTLPRYKAASCCSCHSPDA